MPPAYVYPQFSSPPAAELNEALPRHHPVVVVGAGPVGLALAIDLAQRGQTVLLLDEDHTVSTGSRGLCYAKRTLEILDRLGCGQAIVDKGVTWNVGRTFFDEQEVFRFNLAEAPGHERPGMVNLQQYHLEEALLKRVAELPLIECRWRHQVVGVQPLDSDSDADAEAEAEADAALATATATTANPPAPAPAGPGVRVQVRTPEGEFALLADWLVAADGARSPLRRMLGLEMAGRVFQDRFLIADVHMRAGFPAERWFWFDPPFHRGQSVLLHRQADDLWRIDFQLGPQADPEAEQRPEKVRQRIRAMLGPEHEFELAWVSVYTFQCRRMARFDHGRVLFVGDAAHQVSPFGARGANSGVQDADNLGWKLKAVIDGVAPAALLNSYSSERGLAADDNIRNSTRSTDFITPKSRASLVLRKAVLGLAAQHPFARSLVNSGRLSVPSAYADSPLSSADEGAFSGWMRPGAPLDDAPLQDAQGQERWLLRELNVAAQGGFVLLLWGDAPALTPLLQWLVADAAATPASPRLPLLRVNGAGGLQDVQGLAAQRLDAQDGSAWLIRPDQHIAARWRKPSAEAVALALRRALAQA